MNRVYLKAKREKSLLKQHPWVYSGAIARVEGDCENGSTVKVFSADNKFLALAAISPASQLALRVWSFNENDVIDVNFFTAKFRQAANLRQMLNIPAENSAWRLCASEADGLPGVTVDIYNDIAVVQLSSAGADFHRNEIVQALQNISSWRSIYERSDLAVRKYEKLPPVSGVLAGENPPELLEIHENNRKFLVDIVNGHKSGFYCDQRESRSLVQKFSAGRKVLNLFCYTGGFGIAAALGNAEHVTNVDCSAPALAMAEKNFQLNNIAPERYSNIEADGFSFLRKCRGEKRTFDLIILDPPKLVDSMKNLSKGCRAYKDAMLQAFHLLKPGGILFTFSCSGLVTRELFAKIAADAAADAHCQAQIICEPGQGPDHPVPLAFPEARYLKGIMAVKADL